jgi:hypothetical protein
MIRSFVLLAAVSLAAAETAARADVVLDWNATLRNVIQTDGIVNSPALANPGWSTRTIAMANGAMYDAFQAVNRQYQPFLADIPAPGVSRDAAAAQAAYDVILDCYPLRQSILDTALANTLNAIPASNEKNAGVGLGHLIAQQYMTARTNDGSNSSAPWAEGTLPGQWRSDPLHSPQTAWGPTWGAVQPFAVNGATQFAPPGTPALNSAAYTAAYNQVKEWGALNSPSRTADQTKIALFWAYDRPSMGPPPVLFLKNLEDISTAVGNTPEQNARLFAMTSVAMADAATAAWNVKFADDFWRPISGIREGDNDTNASTVGDPNWVPLGAPGSDPNSSTDDITPPFPSYTSGHATMGGAVFKAIELFYGTNNFSQADANFGNDPVDSQFTLNSQEAGSGGTRTYGQFTQDPLLLDIGNEVSPEGENGTSRIYLGIHWMFDQRDGIVLGNNIASYVFANRFQAVPEPTSLVLGLLVCVCFAQVRCRA